MSTAIDINNLVIGHKGKDILPPITARMEEGSIVALAGPNGSGKTTLFRTLTSSLPPISGTINFFGKPLSQYNTKQKAALFSIVLTEKPDDIFLKVSDIVAAGRYPQLGLLARLRDEDEAVITRSLQTIGIEHLRDRNFNALSDGEKQKVMIAKALVQDTPIIFLDEPSAFLDYPSKIELIQLLMRLAHDENKTILFSSHDLELILRYCDTLWIVSHHAPLLVGTPEKLIEDGSIERYFEPLKVEELFRIRRSSKT